MKDFKSSFVYTDGANFPLTAARNASGSTAKDGTAYNKLFIDDWWGFGQQALSQAGVVPNGNSEIGASQILESIKTITANMTATAINGSIFLGETRSYAGTGSLPYGWLECNGLAVPSGATYNAFRAWIDAEAVYLKDGEIYYTPDHKARVSVGKFDPSYGVGKKGGTSSVSLELNEIPGHRHAVPSVEAGDGGTAGLEYRITTDATDVYTSYSGGNIEGAVGNAKYHENMQPYIVERKMIRAYF